MYKKLDTLYLCYGVKGQPGVVWGHRGQILIFTKMHYLLYVTYYIHVTHICELPGDPLFLLWGQRFFRGHWGHRCQKYIFKKVSIIFRLSLNTEILYFWTISSCDANSQGGPVKLDSMWQHRLTRLVRDRYMYSIRITV